jgi:predicted CoA-binding protein
MSENVAILGASDKPDRYSYQAMELLEEYGHKTFLVHPRLTEIEGRKVVASLNDIEEREIDTLTMYVNPTISDQKEEEILALKPKRVIFNPGTENARLEEVLLEAGISSERACTLVLLRTNQY